MNHSSYTLDFVSPHHVYKHVLYSLLHLKRKLKNKYTLSWKKLWIKCKKNKWCKRFSKYGAFRGLESCSNISEHTLLPRLQFFWAADLASHCTTVVWIRQIAFSGADTVCEHAAWQCFSFLFNCMIGFNVLYSVRKSFRSVSYLALHHSCIRINQTFS